MALSALPVCALVVPSLAASGPTVSSQTFSGYSTGTDLHTDLVQSGTSQVANTEVAFSGASVASQGTPSVTQGAAPGSKAGQVVNEMGQIVQPSLPDAKDMKLAGDRSYGRGSGVEVGLGTTIPSNSPTIPISKVQVSAPPAQTADSQLLNVPANPLANATAVRGTAAADWNNNTCILGKPISQGTGYVANAQLLDTAANTLPLVDTASAQGGGVSSAASQEYLDRATTSNAQPAANAQGLALVSQTREVIAPVTLFSGTPNAVTIEVAPLTLQAVAGGVNGTAYIRYTPDAGTGPTTPIVRISGPGTGSTTPLELTTQQVLGAAGLTIPASPLATVTVGTVPHAIGGPGKPLISADGTTAAAAVDAVSVKLLTPDPRTHLSDIRIGHMEARAQVPAGGISCSIPVSKVADPSAVTAGQTFTFGITITNPFDCTLSKLHVVDVITSDGPTFKVLSATPAATINGGSVTFNDVADIKPHSSSDLSISVKIPSNSRGGTLTDTVHVSGSCGNGNGTGTGTVTGTAAGTAGSGSIPLTGTVTLNAPKVSAVASAALPRTG
ncbi:MAG: hypothetical protein NVS3B26_11690 [Mycobacteriales bacterium]